MMVRRPVKVAIPYKSGKYSYYGITLKNLKGAMLTSQSLINQGNILTAIKGLNDLYCLNLVESQSLINQGNILTDIFFHEGKIYR